MPAVLLVGAFGQHNVGDEALLAAFREALPDRTHLVTTRDAALTAAAGAVPVPADAPVALLRAATAADAVVFTGTVFKTLAAGTGRHRHALLAGCLALAAAARAAGAPVAFVGVGAGALDTALARGLARRLARRADLLVLRDEESARVLADAGVPAPLRVGADAAWPLLESPPPTGAARGRDVLVTVSPFAGGPAAARTLAAGIAAGAPGRPVRIETWQPAGPPPSDTAVVATLADELQRLGVAVTVLPPPNDLPAARRSAAGAALVVAQRFHSCLAAAGAGVPFLAVGHEPKLRGIARRLRQPTVDPAATVEQAATAVAAGLGAAPAGAAAVRAEIAAADAGFDLLRVLLAGGGSVTDVTDLGGLRLEPAPWRASAREAERRS